MRLTETGIMRFDVFFSICQNEVHTYTPSERVMFENFFDQIQLADELGFETAWIAESHLSSEVQKTNKTPVIPHFKGEVGLNTDVLQLAHPIFAKTKRIEVGSAIRNILCNGGPLAHAEAIRMFLSLHGLQETEKRKIHIGFAAGRFDYSNRPYGIRPRNATEELEWNLVKHEIFLEAVEIFCRGLRGDIFSSEEIGVTRTQPAHWVFERLRVIPKESRLELLDLIIGSHDPKAQQLANQFLPCKVFNLSITPAKTIEETHERMKSYFHKEGGPWERHYLPRTVLIFIEGSPQFSPQEQRTRAQTRAKASLEIYWDAMEGTINPERIAQAIENSLCGCPEDIAEQIKQRFHPEDRLMLWFDFNCHDNSLVKKSMSIFMEKVVPLL